MSLNESIVEDTAPQRSTRLAHKPTTIGIFAGAGACSLGFLLVGRLCEAIRRLNPIIPEEASATHRESLSVQNTSKGG